ncbi:WYL domain-containing protein [Photobacterium damselae]|uniref:WYL domain-containing protein n=1 Tax=Photobacterium damselae TaxID=38293 RepID=A0ACD3T2Q3_PHODM|nr:WYL domain-containing protein [Photobacterium damselae]RDL29037.1 WYL domain-containing protein [Photobacterium damselae]TMX48990.1 WYL domain-containing protein [Photobacterium damselae]TMX70461.1 WYL domain-containing protein [Photobacterium damselae]TMX78979.1 WYL domain-containing protein [Photobacterium damselae]
MDNLNYAQTQRLSFIDFKLMFVGHFTRSEVVEHFKMGLSNATRDINLYKELAAHNLTYNNAEKRYFQTKAFAPLFNHNATETLSKLASKLSGEDSVINGLDIPFETPSQLNAPNASIVAVLTQAALNNKAVKIQYISLSRGENTRTVVPHSIVDNGLRWHIRAYDCQTSEFRDFVISRIAKAELSDDTIFENQTMLADKQWMRFVPLELVPHPKNIMHPKAIELDYSMTDGMLKLEVRAALTGYLLRRWNVDCSETATQRSAEHQLWLANRPTLYGVDNLHLASGYDDETTPTSKNKAIPLN